MKTKSLIALVLLLLLTELSFSQNSSIKGKVIDEKTGETMPGVVIKMKGVSKGVSSDMDGEFIIPNTPPGKYTLVFSAAFYDDKEIPNVVVVAGEPTILTVTMSDEEKGLEVVEIVATLNKESNVALLAEQKNNASVSDGMSSDNIKKTPDSRTSDVLKRISGASIQDNKFVVIRGLNDRYNAAYINGAPLPSSESDRKAFAFDIFPSNMLDNLVIIKTATPDLPAEFAGGVIQVNTKNIPDRNFMSISVAGGFNTITTGKNQVFYTGGKKDWLGMDDGSRSMPEVIPAQEDFPSNIHDQAKLAQGTSVDWKLYDKKFSPNFSFQYSLGHTFWLKKRSADSTVAGKPLGIVMAITYNRTNNYNETMRRGYSGNIGTLPSQIDYDYLDKVYAEQVLCGALANVSFKMNDNNSFSFKNLFSINSDDRVINRNGETNPLEANPTLLLSNARWFTGNKIYSGQLSGDHYISKIKLRANWTGSLSQIQRTIPNLRRTIYTRLKNINDPSDPYPLDTVYTANIANSNVGPDYGGGMFFSQNDEKIYSFKGDVKYTFTIRDKTEKKKEIFKTEIKLGGFYQQRSREFFARQLGYTRYGVTGGGITFKDSLLLLDDNSIFDNANMGLIAPGVGGFKLIDGTKPSDKYTASSNLQAAYLMLDHKYKFVRLVWGVRLENFNQKLNAKYSTLDSVAINTTTLDVLPSANLILALNEQQNLRLSYSQTLNRPEYRELAPFAFYDFNTQFVISGDTSLRRAKIYNQDIRYEFYPGRGQLLSVSGFFKQFIDPIEQISRPDVTSEVSFRNVAKATSHGVELEFRTLLGSLFKADSSKFLNNLTVFANLAIIRSKVNVEEVIGSAYSSRPLQGQSPYVMNAGIQYFDRELGMSFSASYNKIGNRISIVGNVNEPDLWEEGRAFFDLQLTKNLWKERIEIKFNAQNILAQQQNFYQNRDLDPSAESGLKGAMNSLLTGDSNNETGYSATEDDLIWSTKFGRVYSLTVSIKF